MIASLVWELLGSAGQFWVERSQQSRAVESPSTARGSSALLLDPPSFARTMNVKHTRPWHQTLEGDSLSRIVYPAPPPLSYLLQVGS